MRRIAPLAALSILLAAASPAWAQEDGRAGPEGGSALGLMAPDEVGPAERKPFFGIDFQVGTPSALGDVFKTAFFGASLRWLVSPRFEISLDYAFMDIAYYYPESAAGPWVGPAPWSSVPSRFADLRGDWIFYHTKHFLAPMLWCVAPLDRFDLPLAIRLGAGPAISFLVPSEAARFYPGLADAYELFNEDFEAYLGLSIRAGLEYRPWRRIRLGAEYLFVVDSLVDVGADIGRYGADYFSRAGNLVVFAGLRL